MFLPIEFKVEKNRVLVPIGEPCPFNCTYCYTRSGEIGASRHSIEEIVQTLQRFASNNSFDIIQLGYDGDPFAHPDRGIALLRYISFIGKHINFSTKALLHHSLLQTLAEIQRTMMANGTLLTALVSFSCWDSALLIESRVPAPVERMQTIKGLKEAGVPTFLALRPILPHISYTEFARLIDEGTRAGCDGFVPGPFYVDQKRRFARFIPKEVLDAVPSQQVTVSWSAHEPQWRRYEDPERLQHITSMIEQKGGRVFFSSVDAIEFACRERLPI